MNPREEGFSSWIRRHRVLGAFAGGALLTLLALGLVGYLVLADQRRSARVLSAALSRALAREVRIDRVTELGTQRVVMRGVRLPERGGWPAEIVAERVEAMGPLLAVARGDEAPLAVVVTRPRVEVPAGAAGAGLATLDGVRQGLARFLTGSMLLDVTLTGGWASGTPDAGAVEFDLVLRKGRGDARAELTLRGPPGAPLVLGADARMDGQTARVVLVGHGSLAPLSRWLPLGWSPVVGAPLALRLDVELGRSDTASGRGSLTLGDVLGADGDVVVQGGVVRAALSRVSADLGLAAAVAGLAWRPSGRAELGEVAVRWPMEAGAAPSASARLRVLALDLPAAAVGTAVAARGLEGRIVLEPAAGGLTAYGEARVARLLAGGLAVAPAWTRYRLALDPRGAVSRADLEALVLRVAGTALQGSAGYDVAKGRVDARLGGDVVDAADLVRRLAPGWLGDADRLRLTGLSVAATGLDPSSLATGAVQLEVRSLALQRTDGQVSSGRAAVRALLLGRGVALALDADRVTGAVPLFRGIAPQLQATLDLGRRPDGGLDPERGTLAVRDGQGRDALTATLRPVAPGRIALSVQAPALERLDGFWPAFERRARGVASVDVELTGPGWRAADGRLVLRLAEAEFPGAKASARDVVAEVPVRRGLEGSGEPPWGKVEVGELIGYGLVLHDLATPARIWNDRLSLNDLTYALYAGSGKGWVEVELEPAGPFVRGKLSGERLRVEEFISAYGIRGGTMTGLGRYDLNVQYRAGRLAVNGRFEVPEGGTVNIELLNRLLAYAGADPSGVLRQALENLRSFDYKLAEADVHSSGTGGDDIRVSVTLKGRERFGIFPPRVREINIRNMPLPFLARQFPGP